MTAEQVAVLLGHAQSTPGSEPVESLESVLPAFEALLRGAYGRPFRWSDDQGVTWNHGQVVGGIQLIGPLLVEFEPLARKVTP